MRLAVDLLARPKGLHQIPEPGVRPPRPDLRGVLVLAGIVARLPPEGRLPLRIAAFVAELAAQKGKA